MHCPHCGSQMQEEHHGVTIDRCHSCGGIWFDADELRATLKRPASARLAEDPSSFAEPKAGAALNCPRCDDSGLTVRKSHGAEVHTCDSCRGVFVDPKALLKILDRKNFGIGDGALDVLIAAPEISTATIKGVAKLVAEIFTGG